MVTRCLLIAVLLCAELARREERFAEKAPSASVRAKPSEPGEVAEADGRSRRPTETVGRKEDGSKAVSVHKTENSRPSREQRPRDRDTAQHKEREGGTTDRSRHVRPAPQKEEASEQPAKRPARDGKADEGKPVERDTGHKVRAAARSSQKPVAPAAELATNSASQAEAVKPAGELIDLRERALISRRPAAKQEEKADAAGEVSKCIAEIDHH